jgi:hypothetical protein
MFEQEIQLDAGLSPRSKNNTFDPCQDKDYLLFKENDLIENFASSSHILRDVERNSYGKRGVKVEMSDQKAIFVVENDPETHQPPIPGNFFEQEEEQCFDDSVENLKYLEIERFGNSSDNKYALEPKSISEFDVSELGTTGDLHFINTQQF